MLMRNCYHTIMTESIENSFVIGQVYQCLSPVKGDNENDLVWNSPYRWRNHGIATSVNTLNLLNYFMLLYAYFRVK